MHGEHAYMQMNNSEKVSVSPLRLPVLQPPDARASLKYCQPNFMQPEATDRCTEVKRIHSHPTPPFFS